MAGTTGGTGAGPAAQQTHVTYKDCTCSTTCHDSDCKHIVMFRGTHCTQGVSLMRSTFGARNAIPSQSFSLKRTCVIISARGSL